MESINLKTIITDVQNAQPGSFESLYEHLVNRVFTFISYKTSGKDVALDITQDCFVELYQSLSNFTYKTDPAFYAFVFTIVRRQLAKYYVDSKKRSHNGEEALAYVPHHDSTEAKLALNSALEQLDETARDIVVLHHWSKYTFAEIGYLINMTESAVRVRHFRACAQLRNVLIS